MRTRAPAKGSPKHDRKDGVGPLSTIDSCQTSNREVVRAKDSMASCWEAMKGT